LAQCRRRAFSFLAACIAPFEVAYFCFHFTDLSVRGPFFTAALLESDPHPAFGPASAISVPTQIKQSLCQGEGTRNRNIKNWRFRLVFSRKLRGD